MTPEGVAAGPRHRFRAGGAALLLLGGVALLSVWWRPHPPPPSPPLATGPAPDARLRAGAAVDPRSGDLVLFGGSSESEVGVDLGDTWTWRADRWRERRPASSPAPRLGPAMAGDPARGTVVLFGGQRRSPRRDTLDDTWTWDGAAWTRRQPPAAPPPGALARGMEFDAATATVVLVVEQDAPAGADLETWTWDGATWSAHPGAGTPPLGWMAATPDGAVLAVGAPDAGSRADTWRWDGRGWLRLAPRTGVRVEPLSAVMAYDPGTERTLLVESEFRGVDGHLAGGTWSWDGTTWAEHHSTPAVVAAFGVTQPLAAPGRSLLLVGGPFRAAYRTAWGWDGTEWLSR